MLLRKLLYYRELSKYQYQSEPRIRDRQLDLLEKFLDTAASTDLYSGTLQGLNTGEPYILDDLPKTRKADYIANFPRGVTTVPEEDVMEMYRSSGTTGEPIVSIFNQKTWDYSEANYLRALSAASHSPFTPISFYWYEEFDEGLHNRFLMRKNRIPVSSSIKEQIELINSYRGALYYFPSMLFSVAKYIEQNNVDIRSPCRIFTHGEILTPKMRDRIEETFDTRVFDHYSTAEFNVLAWECEENNRHLSSDSFIFGLEKTEKGGRLLVTNISNPAMPLIKYDLGDIVEIKDSKCSCGRKLPVMGSILGKGSNFMEADKYISPYSIIDALAPLEELLWFKVIQDEDGFNLEYVPNKRFKDDVLEEAEEKLREVLGDVNITTHERDSLNPGKRGKLPMVENRT